MKIFRNWTGSWLLILLIAGAAIALSACGQKEKGAAEQVKQSTAEKQLWTCGMHPQVIQEEPGNCPICGMKLTPLKGGTAVAQAEAPVRVAGETAAAAVDSTQGKLKMDMGEKAGTGKKKGKKILYWRAPMDPTYISDKPGKSPMGMDLIPVYEGEENLSGGSTLRIDPNVVLNIGVKTADVEVKKLKREIRTVGHVDYDEEKIYRVNLKFSGWVEELYVDETGQEVQKGQPMLKIYSPELVATQEEYLLALKNARKLRASADPQVRTSGEALLQAARRRLQLWDISEDQIRRLGKDGEVVKTMVVHAPHSGIVIHKNVETGQYVKAGMDVFRIADLRELWVYAHLFEYEVPWVKVGDEVEMTSPYVPGIIYRGKVNYIYPYLDKKTRDVKVRILVPNPNLKLKPQMYVNVRFLHELAEPHPVVPSEAVIRTGRRNIVFIALGKGQFEPREVVLGPEGENGEYQILAGLKGGEKVVTSAQFLLDSESRLQEAIQKMLKERMAKAKKQ